MIDGPSRRITVEPTYLDDQSAPDEQRFVWAYHVRIENQGPETVQLRSRYWRITDAFGRVQEVRALDARWVVSVAANNRLWILDRRTKQTRVLVEGFDAMEDQFVTSSVQRSSRSLALNSGSSSDRVAVVVFMASGWRRAS